MAVGKEAWFWRIIGICALSVCSLNVMLLMNGDTIRERTKHAIIEHSKKRTPATPLSQTTTVPYLVTTTSYHIKGKETSKPAETVPTTFKKTSQLDVNSKSPADVPSYLKKPLWVDIQRTQSESYLKPKNALVVGTERKDKAFLVIGVPTVPRKKAFYLIDTLRGLIDGLKTNEREEVLIVVYIATLDETFIKKIKNEIETKLAEAVKNNMIHVLIGNSEFYPSLENLIPLYGDKRERVIWRSKQALDYSFLYFYAANLGQYFLQLEDDVTTEKNYLGEIKNFIAKKGKSWSNLEFGARGFIGMLYRGENLLPLAKFCRFYFWTMPVDWLFRVFNEIYLHGNSKFHIRKPPLFKHIGTFSSLDGQIRRLEDIAKRSGKKEIIAKKYKDADNPTAQVTTTIEEIVNHHPIEAAYSKGYFWGKKISAGDTITIEFKTAIALKKLAIASGSPLYPLDALDQGEIWIAGDQNCLDYKKFGSFSDDVNFTFDLSHSRAIKCIQICITNVRKDDHDRKRWLIISQIAVWKK